MQDVTAVLEDKISDGGDDAFAVRTGDEKDGSVLQAAPLKGSHAVFTARFALKPAERQSSFHGQAV